MIRLTTKFTIQTTKKKCILSLNELMYVKLNSISFDSLGCAWHTELRRCHEVNEPRCIFLSPNHAGVDVSLIACSSALLRVYFCSFLQTSVAELHLFSIRLAIVNHSCEHCQGAVVPCLLAQIRSRLAALYAKPRGLRHAMHNKRNIEEKKKVKYMCEQVIQ